MKLDVILPFHQVDTLLTNAIQSVLESSHLELRLLLIDDRSSNLMDDSFSNQIIDPRVELLRNNDHGYGNAINLGIANSYSDFVALMNSDDLVHPNKFAAQIEMANFEKADIISTKMVKFDDHRKIPQRAGLFHSKQFSDLQLFFGSYSANASCLFRRSWLQSVPPFLNCDMSDFIFALRNYSGAKVVHLDLEYYYYRQHPLQQTKKIRTISPELYSLWNEKSSKLLLPFLSEPIIDLLAIPSQNTKISGKDSLDLNNWLICFKQLLEMNLDRDEVIEYERIIFRRLLAGARSNFSLIPIMMEHSNVGLIWSESFRLFHENFDKSLPLQ